MTFNPRATTVRSVAYGAVSKLCFCNILFTRELAHRLAPHGVTATKQLQPRFRGDPLRR